MTGMILFNMLIAFLCLKPRWWLSANGLLHHSLSIEIPG